MAIIAPVKDGVLDYTYTDSSEEEAIGSDLGYDQFLQLLCAEMQYQDPLEPTSNTEYVAQLATFSQLEATLSMQNTMTNSMANDLVGKQVILSVTSDNTGQTKTVTGTVDYVMYQNGETYLSVDDSLYPISTLDTVADPSYYEANQMAVTMHSMIDLLPDIENISLVYEGAISEIRDFYDGMTSYQQKFVYESDLTTLETVEKRIAELKAAETAKNQGIADDFAETIAALPSTDALTAEDADAVTAARTTYDAMTDAQKAFVSEDDLNKLTALEEKLETLVASEV